MAKIAYFKGRNKKGGLAYPGKFIPLRQGIKTTVKKGNKLPRKGGQR